MLFMFTFVILSLAETGVVGAVGSNHYHYPRQERVRRQYQQYEGQAHQQLQQYLAQQYLPRPQGRALSSYYGSRSDEITVVDSCPHNNPNKNLKLGLKMYQDVIGNKNADNLEDYLLPTYIQHNPAVADGIEAIRQAISPGGILFGPSEPIDFQHVGATGHFVWMHIRRVRPNGDVFAHFDLFRFECGKIAEHWDVIQRADVTQPAANDHPFF